MPFRVLPLHRTSDSFDSIRRKVETYVFNYPYNINVTKYLIKFFIHRHSKRLREQFNFSRNRSISDRNEKIGDTLNPLRRKSNKTLNIQPFEWKISNKLNSINTNLPKAALLQTPREIISEFAQSNKLWYKSLLSLFSVFDNTLGK